MAATVAQTAGITRGASLMLKGVQAGSAIAAWSYDFTNDNFTVTPRDGINTYTQVAHVVNANGSGMRAWIANGVASGDYTIQDPGDWFAVAEIQGCDTSINLIDNASTVALGAGGSGVVATDEQGNISTSAAVAAGGVGLAWCIFESDGGTAIQDNTGGSWTIDSNPDAFSSAAHINNTSAATQTMKWIERNKTTDLFTAIIIVVKVKPPEPAHITRAFA